MALTSSIEVKVSPEIADIAITIIIIGDIIPALTAASPKIKPPNIEIALPLVADIRTSLSLNISKQSIINKASVKAENGTLSLWALRESKISKLIKS